MRNEISTAVILDYFPHPVSLHSDFLSAVGLPDPNIAVEISSTGSSGKKKLFLLATPFVHFSRIFNPNYEFFPFASDSEGE